MSIYRTAALSAVFMLAGLPLYSGQINFVYPPEGLSVRQVSKTFVFGNVSPSTASLTVNGQKVDVYSNGGFIAYLPVSAGVFSFNGVLDDGATAQRSIQVRETDTSVSTGAVSLEFTSNYSDMQLMSGEYLKVSASGTPGREAVFSVQGLFKDKPMTEAPAGSGRYYGSYKVEKPETIGGALTARFKSGLFGRGAEAQAKGSVKILKDPVLVVTSTDTVILKSAPSGGYTMFLPEGVTLVSDGSLNGYLRIALSGDQQAWVDAAKVLPAPGAPYPFGYGSETGSIRLTRTGFGTSASVALYDRLPYTAEVMPWGLRLTLYYANLHTNYVIYDSSDTFIKNVAFRQAATDRVEIDFETAPDAVWGYDVSYPDGSTSLQVNIRARPSPSLLWPRPLSGLTVVLDPGHSVYYKCGGDKRVPMKDFPYSAMPAGCGLDGAVGPLETFEVNVNLAIAQKVREKLRSLGANVEMTRSGDENVELADRAKLAKALGGDLFISIHNNAIGDGEDPFGKPRGFSVYHYHRQSLPLAAAIHSAFVKNIPLPDEGLRFGDYMVARMTWMPAALVENAYMIIPEQEAMLNSASFQQELADTISEGILKLFNVPHRPKPRAKKRKK